MRRALMLAGMVLLSVLLPGCRGALSALSSVLYPESLEVWPRNATIGVGATQQFSMTVTSGQDFEVTDETRFTTWSSSNPTVATIEQGGLATALAPGTTKIKGEYNLHQDEVTLTVTAAQSAVRRMVASSAALSFELTSTGREFAYTIDSKKEQIVSFVAEDGTWKWTGAVVLPAGSYPWSMAVGSSGRWLVVRNRSAANLSVFEIDAWDGVLREAEGSPFAVAVRPMQVELLHDAVLVRDPRNKTEQMYSFDEERGLILAPKSQ